MRAIRDAHHVCARRRVFAVQYDSSLTGSEGGCSMGYPNHFLKGPVRAIMQNGDLAFCKYFELGEQASGSGG